MALIVKKFGGSSVATPEKIFNIVDRVLHEKKEDDRIVIVVSAMGDTTDDLVALAKQVTSKPYGREMDRLLSTGEQVTIALMAMAFNERGQKAVSLTGDQAGITSSDNFNKGRILGVDPNRRLTYHTFLDRYARLLKDNGEVHFKTDNEDLFIFSLEEFKNCGWELKNVTYDLHSTDLPNVKTEYEEKFSAKGQPIFRLEAVKPTVTKEA